MTENGRFPRHERGSGSLGGVHQGLVAIAGDRNHWDVLGVRVFTQLGDDIANIIARGCQVGEDEQRFFLPGASYERGGIRHSPDAIIQILQPIHQLGAGQQFLVDDKRQGLSHGQTEWNVTGKIAKNFACGNLTLRR